MEDFTIWKQEVCVGKPKHVDRLKYSGGSWELLIRISTALDALNDCARYSIRPAEPRAKRESYFRKKIAELRAKGKITLEERSQSREPKGKITLEERSQSREQKGKLH